MSKKILIVEDNKTDANYLGQFLLDENCTIDFAFTGIEAIKNIDANNYSLIFLNHNMPDISGNEILAKIRENKSPNILPVIILGTLNELDEKVLLGADDIITKPFTRIIVKTKIQNLLRLQNKTDELEQQIEEYKQLAERLDDVNRKLVESETRFRMISDYCNDWEMFRDPQNKILYCSPAIERILGYTPEEYTNLSFAEVIYPEDFQKAMSAHGTLTQKGERVEPITFRLVKKNREVIWVEVFGQPVYTPDGRYIGARASTRDISKIKSAEFALKESEEKYKNLFQFMDEGLLRADNEGHIILANDAVAKMFGYNSPEEILGKPTAILYPAETREKLANELKRVHQVFNFEVHTRTKQGKEMYLLCNAKDNINEKGEVSGREGILRDITDLKMIELELRKSEAKLKEANSTKDKFISILAHDLRSPFNALIGFSELLKEDFEDYSTEEIKSFIDNIYNVSTSTFSFLN